jgi:hypothetical protein|tara:strand:- start:4617 stop:5096 length:480 start_codon:yes stop_codon:yes gene_type:complete
MAEEIKIPSDVPLVYPEGFGATWMDFEQYSELHSIVHGYRAKKSQNYAGDKLTLFFLSPVGNKLSKSKIRILSVELRFYEEAIFVDTLMYYGIFEKDEILNANDIVDALMADTQYLEIVLGYGESMYLKGDYKTLRDVLNEVAIEYHYLKNYRGRINDD